MKNNKGFTLIELMGTLVVLAIVITLATTNVVGNMSRARKKTDRLAAKNYVTAVNDYNTMSTGDNRICGTNLDVTGVNTVIKDAVSGKLPSSGAITISCTTYKVTAASMRMSNYTIKFSTSGTNANKYIIQ